MRFLFLRQPEVAACWSGSRVSLLWALLVQVATTVPHTARRLSTVSPDVAKLLAVMTLSKASLSPIRLHPDGNVAKARQMKYCLRFRRPGQVTRNRDCFLVGAISSEDDRHVVIICLTLRTSKPRFTSHSQVSSAGVSVGKWRITAFMGFRDFEKKEK
jgi:hypothetical protein